MSFPFFQFPSRTTLEKRGRTRNDQETLEQDWDATYALRRIPARTIPVDASTRSCRNGKQSSSRPRMNSFDAVAEMTRLEAKIVSWDDDGDDEYVEGEDDAQH